MKGERDIRGKFKALNFKMTIQFTRITISEQPGDGEQMSQKWIVISSLGLN